MRKRTARRAPRYADGGLVEEVGAVVKKAAIAIGKRLPRKKPKTTGTATGGIRG
jgi:hypothetical protein